MPTASKAPTAAPAFTPEARVLLRRKCACGGAAGRSGECEDCRKKKLQRKPDSLGLESSRNEVPSVVEDVLQSPGTPLDQNTRRFMESRFGQDFSRVRIHADARAAQSAMAVDASAYTVGQHVVFGPGQFAPEQAGSRELLAHELTHTLQQGSVGQPAAQDLEINQPGDAFEQEADRAAAWVTSVAPGPGSAAPLSAGAAGPGIQRDQVDPMNDPARFEKVHQQLFVPAPRAGGAASGGGTGSAPPPFDAAAQAGVKKQLTDAIKDLEAKKPGLFAHDLPENTSQGAAEKSAVAMDKQIRSHYPEIAAPLPQQAIVSHVFVMTDAKTSEEAYLNQWLAEQLEHTDMPQYRLKESDQAYQDFLKDLLGDKYLGSRVRELARHKGAFTETSGAARDVYLNRGLKEDQRDAVLVHELVHFYTHPSFREWVDATLDPRFYSEGFTEYLARKAMTPEQLKANAGSYQDRVDRVTNEVAQFVPDADLARAFFAGEVWRIESKSAVAKRAFQEQTGLDPAAKVTEENQASRDTAGINETVAPGEHYRFLNLGNEVAEPKPEHAALFAEIYQKYLQNDPTARVRFVGHASSPGTLAFNDALSLRRAKAFYQMARDAGVPDGQLLDAAKPPHFGETQPTAGNTDVEGRAFNRRVELFITHAALPTTTGSSPGTAAPGLQRQLAPASSGRILQRKPAAVSAPAAIPASVHTALRSAAHPLPASTRAYMEPRFGRNFGEVRIHSDRLAAQSADDVAANAYAVGRDIVFGAGRYQPETEAGRRLLAHELAHVARNPNPPGNAEIAPADGPEERIADVMAEEVSRGGSVQSLAGAGDESGARGQIYGLTPLPLPALRRQASGTLGWSGATGPNKGKTTQGGIDRFPLDKLPVGRQTASTPSGKAIVLLPSGFNPDKPADVLLYFHGHNAGFQEAGGTARDIATDKIEAQVAASNRTQLIGVLPQGDANSSFGEDSSLGKSASEQKFFQSDAYLDAVLNTLVSVGAIAKRPSIGSVMLTGHSGAGELINEKLLAGAKGSELPQKVGTLREVALFDAVNGPKEYESVKAFLRAKLQADLNALKALPDDTKRAEYLKTSFRFRAYFSHFKGTNYYRQWHTGPVPKLPTLSDTVPLDQVIADFFSQTAAPALSTSPDILKAFRDHYQVLDAGDQVIHDNMVADQDHLKESLKVLPKLEAGVHDVPNLAPPAVHAALRSSGRPLERSVRAWAEARFQKDFGAVRIHDHGEAARSTSALQARAYTVGHHLVFGPGEYAPDSMGGRSLMLHELAHVVQQGASDRPLPAIPEALPVGKSSDAVEQEADRAASDWSVSVNRFGMVRLQRKPNTVDAAVCETTANPHPAELGTCNYKEPEHCATYESWISTFTLLKGFTAKDTPGTSGTGSEVIGGEAADQDFGKPSTPPKTAPPPTSPLKPGERFVDHPTDQWVQTCLPANLRATAYQLPADCADVAMILRHVWLAAHHRTEPFGKFVLGDAAGNAAAKDVLNLISEVGTGSVAGMVAPYSEPDAKPIRSFARLEPLLHPGDILVWWHYDNGFDKPRTGGHTHTIAAVDRSPDGKIQQLTLLQGNEPLFAPQKKDIHDFLTKENPKKAQPTDKELGEAPGRRVERTTSKDSGLTFGDVTVKQGKETVTVWKWPTETLLVAAGPPRTAARPPAQAQKGDKGTPPRRLTDWIPAFNRAAAAQLDGTFEGTLFELRATVEGGADVAETDVRAVAAAAGERVWQLAKAAKDLGNESHFQRLRQLLEIIRGFEDSRDIAMSRKLDAPYDITTGRLLQHLQWFREAFELAARGASSISFGPGTPKGQTVNVLLTGFDPFEPSGSLRPPDPGQWNPSGAAVLALDQQRLPVTGSSKGAQGTAAVEGIVLPVSFNQFSEGIVEQAVGPHVKELDALLTVSMDGGLAPSDPIRLEHYAVGVHEVHGKIEGVSAAAGGAVGPAIIESNAPLQQIASGTEQAAKGKAPGIPKPTTGEAITFRFAAAPLADSALKALGLAAQGTAEIIISDAKAIQVILSTMTRVGTGPDIRFTAAGTNFQAAVVEGPGGNFLSNEVSYRAQRLLRAGGSANDPLSFHVHTPGAEAIPQVAGTAAERKTKADAQKQAVGQRQTLIQTLKRLIGAVAGQILDRRAAKSPAAGTGAGPDKTKNP